MRIPLPAALADYLINRAKRTPYLHISDYMERYWLVPYKGGGSLGGDDGTGPVPLFKRPISWLFQRFDVALRIHNILRSDDDRAYHDHPWPYLTIILKGGYWEHRPVYEKGIFARDERVWRGPGSILLRSAESLHRLEVEPGIDCWTLFTTGKYKQTWGFVPNPAYKIPYRKYLQDNPSPTRIES